MRALLILLMLLAAAPALAQKPDARKAELDQLFAALKAAPTEDASTQIGARIQQAWQQAGSPAVLLLLNRSAQDLHEGDADGALDAVDDALVLAPDYPETWLRRAVVRLHLGDYRGAIRDIEAVLAREPRHFVALQTLSHIAEAQGDWKGALAAWKKALEIDPRAADGQERLQLLQRRALGEPT